MKKLTALFPLLLTLTLCGGCAPKDASDPGGGANANASPGGITTNTNPTPVSSPTPTPSPTPAGGRNTNESRNTGGGPVVHPTERTPEKPGGSKGRAVGKCTCTDLNTGVVLWERQLTKEECERQCPDTRPSIP